MTIDPAEGQANGASATSPQDDFVRQLAALYKQLKFAKNLKKAMKEVEGTILELMGSKMFTIYQSVDNGKEIVASFKGDTRPHEGDDDIEIRVPFTPTSLAGYVALSQHPLLVEDVYNAEKLTDIHARLQWDKSFSESQGLFFKSMIVVPIKDDILLGVVQLIRLKDDPVFNNTDLKHAQMLAQMLAKQFRSEFQSTQGPYDYLVQQGKISAKDLDEIEKGVSLYGGTITKMLMEDYKIESSEIGKSLELYYRVPYMKYDPNITLPVDLMENLGASYLRNNLWVPVSGSKEEVTILISNPSDYQRIMEIQGILNAKNYVFRIGLPEDILMYLGGTQEEELEEEGFDDVFKSLQDEGGIEVDEDDDDQDDSESAAAASGIIQLVNRVIVESDRLGGSDIHIEPGKDKSPGIVRVRVDGICREILKVPAEHTGPLIARIKVMSRLDISERRLPQDGKCKLKIRGRALELRVATVPTVNGESAVLRLLAAGSAMPLDKMNLSPANMESLLDAAKHPHGLLLVVGPTGSGKTTTLHAVLGYLNQPDRKIWTAEDPVEITQPGLQQVQMQPKIGFTFAAAMRAFLRADPDIILIGEMRDHETASIGIEASLTGHLVLSTLHTNSAPETITRLLDLGLDPVNFSDALLAILAQRLIRTLCGKCKETYKPEDKELNHLIEQYGTEDFKTLGFNPSEMELCRAVGCEACGDTGYKGRTGVHELLVGTHELQSMIYKKADLSDLTKQAIKDGMRTLKQDGIHKIFTGYTDYEQLLRIIAE
ncbi:MAG: Flp pilus assembly complex ATPase component TadA [Gammaproteobacteria bacterium]|nr:Flp pilus assembly complex ATPase component TadA [Gammaproteobacteria bacterium]